MSYSGEQAFELHIPNTQLYAAHEIIVKAGDVYGLIHFGMYAIDSMRMEKGFGHWKAEFITEYNPIEAGLKRFVNLDKDFPGKEGLLAQIESGCRAVRVVFAIGSSVAPVQPGEGVFHDGIAIGSITSASWGYRAEQNLAMAYVAPEYANENAELDVLVLGDTVKAKVCKPCLFDSRNLIPRGIS